MTPYYHAGLSQPSLFFKKTLSIFARPRPLNRFVLGCHMIVTRSYVRKLEFCNLIGALTFQYAAILLDQEILPKVTRPFPGVWERGGRGLGTSADTPMDATLRPRGGRTLHNRTQCLMSQQFLLRRECMDKSKSLLQQNRTEIGEVMLPPGCTLTETYRILTDPRRSPTFQRVIAKSTRTSAACATCTQ